MTMTFAERVAGLVARVEVEGHVNVARRLVSVEVAYSLVDESIPMDRVTLEAEMPDGRPVIDRLTCDVAYETVYVPMQSLPTGGDAA